MAEFTFGQGKRYRATLTLGWIEQIASNDMIAAEFAKAGFGEVVVQGEGETRLAQGTWTGASREVDLPGQVVDVVEVA